MIDVGQKAPSIALSDQHGKNHTLDMYSGKWIVLYFYPKDDTPGCTKEACGFRDATKEFDEVNAVILGVSCDSAQSHEKFIEKYDLPFALLADTEKTVVNDYGVWVEKNMYGKKYMGIKRMTFLIDPKGVIAKIYKTVKPVEHAAQVCNDIRKQQKTA